MLAFVAAKPLMFLKRKCHKRLTTVYAFHFQRFWLFVMISVVLLIAFVGAKFLMHSSTSFSENSDAALTRSENAIVIPTP